MSIELTDTSACRGDTWLRHQKARIEQRHLQSGRHCRLDTGSLLMRVAHRVRVAPLAAVAVGRKVVATDPMQHSPLEGVDDSMPPAARDAVCVPEAPASRTAMPHAATPNRGQVRGPATLGDFVAGNRAGVFARREWVATLADGTTVVVNDWCDSPSVVGIEKAVSIVQSRAYLEHRGRGLLLPFTKEAGSWRLVTIDFATEAQRHGCEFVMCFAFRATNGVLSITSPFVQIGFALPSPAAMDPVFVLTIVTAVGFRA